MFIILCIYNSLLYALSPVSFLKREHMITEDCAILSYLPREESFYRDGLLYFLRSSSPQDFESRVRKWCARFDIPTEFDQRWTPLWYGKENVSLFEDIKARWEKDYGLVDSLNLFDEMHIRDMEAVSSYINSYSGVPNSSHHPSYQDCLHHFFDSPSIEEYNKRIETYCKDYHVPPSARSTARLSQKNYDITPVIEDLHRRWQDILQDKIPDHIDNDRSRSIETLLMLASLSCFSFDTEPLKTAILKKMQSAPQSTLPTVASLDNQTKEALKEGEFIDNNNSWNERQLYLMTSYQVNALRSQCNTQVIASLYSQSFFYLLRELAQKGASHTTPPDMREKFISELEIYMVKLYLGKEEAFLQEKSEKKLYFLDLSSLAHYEIYLESVHHFYQKMKRLKPHLKTLSHQNEGYRTEREFQELWTNLLEGETGLCPAGAIERPLFYLEEFHDWSNVSCENELFLKMIEHYYAHIVEKIAGLDVFLNHLPESNEAHARIHVHNVLSQGPFGFLSEVDKQQKDIYAVSYRADSYQNIERHFLSLFTPFHFGQYVLEFFQDKRFLKIFAKLKKAQQKADLFMDDHYQAFRIDHLIRCLGEGFISFNSPKILKKQLWLALIRTHQFSQLHRILQDISKEERRSYWEETIGIQRSCLEYVLKEAEISDIEYLKDELHREISTLSIPQKELLLKRALCGQCQILLNRLTGILGTKAIQDIIYRNFSDFLYHCLHHGSLDVLECFLMLTTDLQKINISFEGILNTCLQRDRIGLDILKYLLNNAIVSLPEREKLFIETGESFLTYIITTIKNEQTIMHFLKYFIEELRISPQLLDKTPFAHTPFHWACQEGYLSVVKYLIEKLGFPPNYCDPGKQSALNQAARVGHLPILQYMIEEQNASPTLPDKTEFALTPLHWACRNGHFNIVRYLIETQKVSPDYCEPGKQSALSQAAIGGHLHILKYLIETQGVSPTLPDKTQHALTPLHWACLNGHLNVVKYLIETQKVPPNYCDPGKQSALSQAAIRGHLHILKYFIETYKVPPTLPDKTQRALTPLHWACQEGQLNIVKYLIETHKVSPDYCDEGNQSALSQATIRGHLHILKYLIETHKVSPDYCDEGNQSALSQATIRGHLHILKYLIETQGASPTLPDKTNYAFTPLHWACLNGHLNVVKYLIETHKVPPDYCEPGKQSALSQAAIGGHLHILKYLIETQGVSPTLPDKTKYSFTPLHWACGGGHLNIVKYLIEIHNVSPDHCDPEKQSALSQAAIGGHLHILKYLIETQGASPTLPDKTNYAFTPLHWACLGGHLNIVKYLIEIHNVPPDYCDPGKQSALSQAAIRGHLHILKYLIETQGVSPTLPNQTQDFFTPLDWACQNGHLSIVKWLVEKKRVTLNFERFIKIAIQNNHILIVEYFLCECGAQLIEEIETFLVEHRRIKTLQKLVKIANISNFLEQGYNPFLSAHRFNQLHEAIRKNKLNPTLWDKLDRWSHYFVHNTDKYSEILILTLWDRLLFWNRGHLSHLNAKLILRSS